MKRKKEMQTNRWHGTAKKVPLVYKAGLAVLTLVVLFISSAMVWNVARLQRAMEQRTQIYVEDVSLQLANSLDYRLQKITRDLELLQENILQFFDGEDSESLKEFLYKQAEKLGFSSIWLLQADGPFFTTGPFLGDPAQLTGIQASLQGESGVTFLDNQSILYSIPIYRDNRVVGVLAGEHNREHMQQLIQTPSFSGQGLTCITDSDGNVIISPTDLAPFLQLEDIFMEESDSVRGAARDIAQMLEDMKNRTNGAFSFTAVDGTELILSYDPLESYEWTLLTLVPANLISYQLNIYTFENLIIIAGIILLFFMILFVMFKTFRKHFRQMEKAAFIDRLTGAMNNTAFQISAAGLLQNAPPNTYAVVLLHLKNFKLINEGFGSAEGDLTLCHMMRVLSRHVSSGELAAHADADQFFLCLKESNPDVIRQRIKAMSDEINAFNQALEEPYYLILQPGAYVVDDPALEITVIQDRAHTACRDRSPFQDGQCIFYDTAVTRQLQKERELNDLFEYSLQNGDFKLYLQPKVRLDSNQVGGAEALVRWQHPQRGMIYPSDFIPLFEKNGKICRIDLFIFEEVCKTLRRWLDCGAETFPVSINLSRQHFQRTDCLEPFYEIAQQYRIPRGLIEMELTESIFFDDQGIAQVKEQIRRMHEMGFLCSLDDFGAGYSSLGLLMEFDVDVIKLDRRFFLDVESAKAQKVIVSIIQLSKEIGVHIVAEGIETGEQLRFLRQIGCDQVQGYIFSKPLPTPEFEQWLNSRSQPEA